MRRALILLLAAQIVLGALYALATPVFEASDEIWHYPVVREIVTRGQLPVQDPAVEQPWAQEGSQPLLYYLTAAGLTAWIDTADYGQVALRNPFTKIGIPGARDNVNLMAHAPGQSPLQGGTVLAVSLIRWLSILFGTATAWLAYRLAGAAVPGRPALALLAAALVAFNPMVLFIGASVNNDTLLMLLATLALLLLARDVESEARGMRWQATIVLGVVLGAAALTKVSGLVLLPVAALAVTLEAARSRDWRTWLGRGLVLIAIVVAVSGWWYARNVALYGEPTGMQRMVEIAGPRPAGFALSDLRGEWKSFWYSFWGVFGAFNILAKPWFYAATGALSLIAGAGLVLTTVRMMRRRHLPARWRTHALMLTFLALTAGGLLRWTMMTPASQGRLMFSGIAPVAVYLATGLLAWFPRRWHAGASYGMAAALALIALAVPLTTLLPAYRPDPPIAALPPDAVALNHECGDGIVLAGYRLNGDTVRPGQPLDITLYWQASKSQTTNLDLSLNAYGYRDENVAKLDTWPGGGLRPTSFWEPGVLYADGWRIATNPASASPTTMKLGVSWDTDLLDPAKSSPVVCYVDGKSQKAVVLDAGVLAGPFAAAATEPAVASLQHGIVLLDSEVESRDDQLLVTLNWSAREAVPGDYTVFVHLFDAAGNKVAQGDAPPRDGFWPTGRWRSGESVTSTHTLDLPQDLPPGEYTLGAGMYDPATGARLFAYDATGAEWRDWMIVLATLNLP
ncbi:MAG: glycosyltransferase family 39 protein [Caldilineales bacterium]